MAGSLEKFYFQGQSIVYDVFVETGTYLGQTSENAARAGFGHVHTIEVSDRLFALAEQRFSGRTDITVHHGSSPSVLLNICDPKRRTVFYLDGHYQGGPSDENDPVIGECPLILELNIIRDIAWEVLPLIIIDDSKIFTTSGKERDELLRYCHLDPVFWPTYQQVIDALGLEYSVYEEDDRLYCVPNVTVLDG